MIYDNNDVINNIINNKDDIIDKDYIENIDNQIKEVINLLKIYLIFIINLYKFSLIEPYLIPKNLYLKNYI